MYTDAGFKTLLGIHPLSEWNPFASIVLGAYKLAAALQNATAVAMPYGSVEQPIYGPKFREAFGDIPVFLFHVPDEKALLFRLLGDPDVRVLLVGRDKSIARFDLDACPDF